MISIGIDAAKEKSTVVSTSSKKLELRIEYS